MNTKKIAFKVGSEEIIFELQEPIKGYLKVECCSPWSTSKLAFNVAVESFIEDIESLLPSELTNQNDLMQSLFPCFIETIDNHIAQYGRIADADFSSYANYLALIYIALSEKLNNNSFTKNDIPTFVAKLASYFEKNYQIIERTPFSRL